MIQKQENKLSTSELISKFIGKNQNKPWRWDWISMNRNITMEMIEKYTNKPWDWEYMSCNSNITMEFVEKYSDKPWNWHYMSYNPNITMEIMEKYPNKNWDWFGIPLNTFTREKELFYNKYYRIYLATFRLQQYFNRMYDNPKYKFCRTRLKKMFS